MNRIETMRQEILDQLRGERLSRLSFVKVWNKEFESVVVHLDSGKAFEFQSREFKFGRYEAYALRVSEHQSKLQPESVGAYSAAGTVEAGWTIGKVEVFERQDWLEPGRGDVSTIGNNPTTHAWGPAGSAPKEAIETVTIESSILLVSSTQKHQVLIYVSDYPGYVLLSTNPKEIAAVLKAHHGEP